MSERELKSLRTMDKEKSKLISDTWSYVEAAEDWDSHDLGDVWEKTEAVEIDVDLRSEKFYYSV